jgi:DNA anti-recombination protein RmuC
VAKSAPDANADAQKRRSTRIVQAVPLTVTGVDALGRPFQERTSTSIINCHGCRYQSKHYVLKNMWVTLEVPHPEQGQPPRTVRARVMWIQRPRTVRELFQIGVDLEVPGNFWGIAFPPADWCTFPEAGAGEIPASPGATTHQEEEVEEPWAAAPPELAPLADKLRTIPIGGGTAEAKWAAPPEPAPAADKLRTIPTGGGPSQEAWAAPPEPPPAADDAPTLPAGEAPEASLTLAREMARLVNEAKQQLDAAVRESAAEAVSAETRPLLAALQKQLRDAAERSVEAASGAAAEAAVREALGRAEERAEAHVQALVERSNEELSRNVERTNQEIKTRLDEIERERRGAFEQQLEEQVQRALAELRAGANDFSAGLARDRETLEKLGQQAEDFTAKSLHDATARLQQQADDVRARLDELENAARESKERISSTAAAAQAEWKARMEADLAAASARWDASVETSLAGAAERAAERLAHTTQAAGDQFEKEIRSRIATTTEAIAAASREAESELAATRASLASETGRAQEVLTRVQSAAQGVAEQSARLDGLVEAARQEFERRIAALVEVQSQELARRAEGAIAGYAERLQPSIEAAGQETIARLGTQIERQLGLQFDRANQVLARLQNESLAAEDARRKNEGIIEQVSGQAVEAAVGQLQKRLDQLRQDFQETARTVAANTLANLEAKGTETTLTTFESLFKTADWYEKKVQTQMQATLEKGLEQAADHLRDKAGEISGVFAAELDHYSRSYVEHTQGQIEEVTNEDLERARKQSAEMLSTAIASLAQQIESQTRDTLRDLDAKLENASVHLSAQTQARIAQASAEFATESQRASSQFRADLTQQTQKAIGNSREQLAAQVELSRDNLHLESQAQEKQLRETLASLGDQGIEAYKQRLESATNSWLVTTVAKLNQQSQQHVDALARSTEERLRDTCKQVFAGVGETLRQRLLDLTAPPTTNGSDDESK